MSDELADRAQRVDRALAGLAGLDATSRSRADELQAAIEAFHKEGLTRIVRTLKADPRGLELLMGLAEDPEVYALFALHGLVRGEAVDLPTRVARALESARPYLQSHGGDVELVEIVEQTVYVRLSGACHGCSMSASTLRNSVEEAVRAAAPEITAVEPVAGEPTPVLIPLDSLRKGKGWVKGPAAADIVEGRPFRMELDGGKSVVLLRFGDQLQAFDNACAHLGMPLDGGMVDVEAGTLTCPWHGFRFDGRSGECLTAPEAQLEPFPLRIEDGIVSVRPR